MAFEIIKLTYLLTYLLTTSKKLINELDRNEKKLNIAEIEYINQFQEIFMLHIFMTKFCTNNYDDDDDDAAVNDRICQLTARTEYDF